VTPSFDDRLTRYALFAALHGVVVIAAVLGAFGSASWLVVLVVSVPLLFAWGHFRRTSR